MEVHYLDNASTTKPCAEAVETIIRCLTTDYGNPSSLHKMGLNAQLYMDNARKNIAKVLGCNNVDSILFTSGATESSNISILGTAKIYGKRKKKVVTTTIEHASVKECFNELERQGFEVVKVSPNKDGEITYQDIVNAVDDNTFLVSCMLVNNETGYILPIEKAYNGIKKKYPDVITHCDCVQGFLKVPINVRTLKADLISISGHKVHAPKGVGALYVSKGTRISKSNLGGKQERGFRSGTEALPNIAGFGSAVEVYYPTIKERFEYVSKLKQYLIDSISKYSWICINSKEDASPYIVNISVLGVRSEIMLHFLEEKGVYISSGSACSKGEKSGVLSQFGLSERHSDSAIRVSFCETNTTQDIDAFATALVEGFNKILKS
ncbi:MAG: cysteine desulfurase [Ruminococcus sp.]|nr:cysteine desulfurase [Ruminococcus sp.]